MLDPPPAAEPVTSISPTFSVIVAAVLAVAGLAGGCGGSEEASTTETRASAAAVPNPLPPGRPGDLIRAQPLEAPSGARGWRILYHSRSPDGRDIAVSGLIVAPDEPRPAGGFPVIAWAHGTTGLADKCAPSQLATRERIPLPDLWLHGYVVVGTDYEGLGTPGPHPYLVGEREARGVLDSVRAARNVTAARAGAATVVVGHSQGGHAALFAGELAPSYAPDIDVLGVVAASPVAELALLAERVRAKLFLGYLVALARAYSLAYPGADFGHVLTPSALDDVGVLETECTEAVLEKFARPAGQVLVERAFEVSPWPELLSVNSPGNAPTSAPILVVQGGGDDLIPAAVTERLVAHLCRRGDVAEYRLYPASDHDYVFDDAEADIVAWINARVGGARPSSSCGP